MSIEMSRTDSRSGSSSRYGTITHGPEKNDAEQAGDDAHSEADSGNAPAGVKTIEGISMAWSSQALFIAYLGIYLMAFSTSLEQLTTSNLTAYATSAFKSHSLLSTVNVVYAVFLSVIKPVMAKIADVFGRFEAFVLAVFIYVLGYIQLAASDNVQTFAAAQLFYAAGFTGLQILQQIFIADTSNLINRALFSAIPDLPYLVTYWVGPLIAASLLSGAGWRWGYGIWAIVLPVAYLPLLLSLFINKRKAKRLGYLPVHPLKGQSFGTILKTLWYDLDFFGLLLLTAAECLILIPLTIASTASKGWANPSIIAMLVVGGLSLIAFIFWERSKKLAPKAFFPRDLFRSRTVLAGVTISFFYYMAFYLSVQPYFYSYLQVVDAQSVVSAARITNVFLFASSASAVLTGLVIKYVKQYKYFVTLGSCIYLVGIGLMVRFRNVSATTTSLVGTQVCVGIGGGMLIWSAQLGVQASVSHQQVAAITAIFLTILEIGGAVGSAVSGAVWSSNILPKLEAYLPPATKINATDIYSDLSVAVLAWPPGTPTRDAIDRAYQETMNILLIIAVCFAAVIVPLSFSMKNYKLADMDQKVKGRVIGGTEDTAGLSEEQATGYQSDVATSSAESSPRMSPIARLKRRAKASSSAR